MIKKIILFIAAFFVSYKALAANMTDLGTLGGTNSSANGVSADGSVIVGNSDNLLGEYRAFKYAGSTMTDLGTLGGTNSYAYGASADGSVIVGDSSNLLGEYRAFKYAGSTMTDLGTLGGTTSSAFAVSADGSVIVGSSRTNTNALHAFKYIGSTMTSLGTLGGTYSAAFAVSADGSVIVGNSDNLLGQIHAFKYAGSTMTDLGTLGGTYSSANAVSADGSVIVGASSTAGDAAIHAFKYVGSTMTDLGTLKSDGSGNSSAKAVSADGSVIVGESDTDGGEIHAFIYRNSLVDISNTIAALGKNAAQLNSILNLNSNLLYTTLDQDADLFGKNNISISIGSRASFVGGNASYLPSGAKNDSRQLGAFVKAAYRFNENFHAGIMLDQAVTTYLPNNFKSENSLPMMSIFANLHEHEDGRGAYLKASLAYSSTDLNITRDVMQNTEAGAGSSRLTSQGALAEVGYGFNLKEKLILQPFAGIRYTQVMRNSFTETSGADFPITFQAAQRKATTSFFGAKIKANLTDNATLKIGAGIEHDLASTLDGYKGNISYLGAFDLTPTNVRKTRSFATAGLDYKLSGNQKLSLDLYYNQQALYSAKALTAYAQYVFGF